LWYSITVSRQAPEGATTNDSRRFHEMNRSCVIYVWQTSFEQQEV
jgi:hypothetical protein